MDEVETIDQRKVGRNEQGALKMGFGILWLAIGIGFALAAWFGFGFWQAQTAQASRINALGLEVAGLAQVEDQMRVLSQSVDRQRVLLQEFEQAVGVQVERLQALEHVRRTGCRPAVRGRDVGPLGFRFGGYFSGYPGGSKVNEASGSSH